MTFEEFFTKKKINLVNLQQGEPELFSEFKIHFERMGEKSFDHTKKYWFNKLRLRFPAPPEPKIEKVVIENPLAEQTVTETLAEKPVQPAPKVGFTPRFKAGATKPAETQSSGEIKPEAEKTEESEKTVQSTPKVGFTPRFKAGTTKPAETSAPEVKPETAINEESKRPSQSAPKVGFTPRFKAGVTKPAEPSQNAEPEKPKEDTTPPALGFKPKFKAGVTKTVSPAPEQKEETKEDQPPAAHEVPEESNEIKPAYKPRFNMKNMKPKGEE